ncbi:MAG: hypothetical protein PHV33_13565 [Elusimicrobiales bacterium]|nr:hypothetical protein [Elusimicrobiales bacterium]
MLKKLISSLGALALFAGLASTAAAQQLYINSIDVGDGGYTYCNSGALGTSRSFVTAGGNPWRDSAYIQFERPIASYPGACLALCVQIVCVSTAGAFGIDELSFEVFKFAGGSNPLDPASTPPIRTINMYNIGTCPEGAYPNATVIGTYCANWDGSYNMNGMFGKTNGQFGFRAKVKTNQVSQTAGNISIEQTSAYPGQNQIPIQVNVTNIHSVRSSPTVVGRITGVGAAPYNMLYRLSKDALVTMKVYRVMSDGDFTLVRTLFQNVPRVGEGTPDGTLTNGDFWDGRDSDGNFVPAGNYITEIDAKSNDAPTYATDNAWPVQVQMSLDPLQITDVAIKPLGPSSTDMATLSYMLTEAATVYVNIYPPGTDISFNTVPPNAGVAPLRSFMETQTSRQTQTVMWDGRDNAGHPVCDGDYMYAVWAELPSSYPASGVIRSTRTMIGTIPVARGDVLALLNPSSTVIGSTQQVAGLDPFYFRYTPSRDAWVTLNIKRMTGDSASLVRRVVNREMRFANFSNRELWDGKDDAGLFVSSGSYLAELITEDPFQCSQLKTSTVTAVIPVDMFRTVDLRTTPLMGGTSDTARIAFELSQPMYMKLNIYPTSTVINPAVWPPTVAATPKYSVEGMRPGRFRVTEYWDGRDTNGRLVEDGRYPFTLVAYTTGTAQVLYATDKTYGYVDVSRGKIIFTMFDVVPTIPTMYNSSDTVKLPPYEIDYAVTRQSRVSVKILDANGGAQHGQTIATVIDEDRGVRDGDILYKEFWDGKDDNANFVAAGSYDVRITAKDIDIDPQLNSMATVQMTIDVDPLRIYDVSIIPLTLENPAVVSYQVSEPMKVATKIYKPGTNVTASPWIDPPGKLVKRIVGVRPARTSISEYWDGTDLTLSKVPDGNYVFSIYGSTVTENISTLNGDVTNAAYISPDVITANVPVTRGGTADLCADFAHESFFAPNPYTGTSGWFKIPLIMNGWVSLKMYNIAGDLVYKRQYGDVNNPRAGGDNIDGNGRCSVTQTHEACWPRVNSYGRTVAPGVYFAVIRFEATDGTKDVCQTIKKILIP